VAFVAAKRQIPAIIPTGIQRTLDGRSTLER
jgi:hypothetical protein